MRVVEDSEGNEMIEQLKTIREALEYVREAEVYLSETKTSRALTALAQIEQAVGSVEPVAITSKAQLLAMENGYSRSIVARDPRFAAIASSDTDVPLYTATPPTQQPQYEAGDVASASAQGFRDGVASVAQQPQARPDFNDEWTGYLKDGETPFERFLRERKDVQSVLKLYQRALEENERLKAQQPQAEPDIHEAQGQIEFLDKKNNALSAAIRKVMARLADLLDEDQFKEIEETISSAGVQPQAEAVPLFAALKVEGPRFHCAKVYGRIYQVLAVGSNKEDLLTVARLAKDAYYKQFPGTHEYKEPPFEWVVEEVPTAQPKFQPTEAVPSDVVRDAERYRFLAAHCRSTPEHWGGRWSIVIEGPCPERQDCEDAFDAAIDAAIAQEKGQP